MRTLLSRALCLLIGGHLDIPIGDHRACVGCGKRVAS